MHVYLQAIVRDISRVMQDNFEQPCKKQYVSIVSYRYCFLDNNVSMNWAFSSGKYGWAA